MHVCDVMYTNIYILRRNAPQGEGAPGVSQSRPLLVEREGRRVVARDEGAVWIVVLLCTYARMHMVLSMRALTSTGPSSHHPPNRPPHPIHHPPTHLPLPLRQQVRQVVHRREHPALHGPLQQRVHPLPRVAPPLLAPTTALRLLLLKPRQQEHRQRVARAGLPFFIFFSFTLILH